jgi:hypothetical protein
MDIVPLDVTPRRTVLFIWIGNTNMAENTHFSCGSDISGIFFPDFWNFVWQQKGKAIPVTGRGGP